MASRLPVRPLDGPALAELAAAVLGRPPSDRLVGWLLDRSRGYPLDAHGLLSALLDAGADLDRPALDRLPDALSGRVAQRLHGVDPEAVGIVELLAVVGRRTDLRSLVALAGRAPAELVDALERLVHARLVTEDESGPELTVEVTHPLVADAVYERMSAARRRLLHREVGRVLRSAGRLGEAAGHFVRAAERAGAVEEALSVLGALVRLLPAGDPRWLDVVDALSWDAQWALDHRADSHSVLGVPALRAMDAALAGLDDPGRQAPVKLRLAGFLAWGNGGLVEAERVCREAAAQFERAGDRRGSLLATHELAWIHGLAGDIAVLEDEARDVADAAQRCGDAGATRSTSPPCGDHALPLIRYELTDQIELLDDHLPCVCGCTHRRIADPYGRLDDVFTYGAITVHPHVFRSALSRRPEIMEYQVRQTSTGARILTWATDRFDTAALAAEVTAGLGRLGVPAALVEVELVDRLARSASGKLARFVRTG